MLVKTDLHKVGQSVLSRLYTYKSKDSNSKYLSKLVSKEIFKTNNSSLTTRGYEYDDAGNLIKITDSKFGSHTYEYDYRGFLVKADDTKYTYDGNGNITKKGDVEFNYDSTIKDRLNSVNGVSINYDENNLCNPKSWNGNEYTFEGRRLTKLKNSNGTYEYIYDDQGLRIEKYKSTGEQTIFQYDNGNLSCQFNSSNRLDFLYDENGELYGFIKDNTDKYFYVRDVFKNILGIINENGNLVVEYNYDPYGVVTISGTLASTIGVLNPFRYKGYYFDSESNMYYCKSRYYVPEWCRWLNCDNPNCLHYSSVNEINLFSYCANNPIEYFDSEGKTLIGALISGAILILGVAAVGIAVGTLIYVESKTHIIGNAITTIKNNVEDAIYDLKNGNATLEIDWVNSKNPALFLTGFGIAMTNYLYSRILKGEEPGTHRHHIIAQNSKYAWLARMIWTGDEYMNMDINDEMNIANVRTPFHRVMHTKLYYTLVNVSVGVAYAIDGKEGVLKLVETYKEIMERL